MIGSTTPGVLVSGGTGVSVSGGMGVSVSGGIGVFVSEGMGVFVSGTSVFVGGREVLVGGMAVLVGGGLWVEVGGIRGRRVWVGCLGVKVITTGEVEVEVEVGEAVGVLEGNRMGVSSKLIVDNACTVSAETVLILLTARSTMLAGSRPMGVGWLGEESAIAEVKHSRLMPRKPAATTPRRLV
jgi:hypothetical protein